MNQYPTQNIELYAKDEEIERLKKEVAFQTDMADQADVACLRLKSVNADLQTECMARGVRIADLERLIVRAADALETEWLGEATDTRDLIAELRKAVQ